MTCCASVGPSWIWRPFSSASPATNHKEPAMRMVALIVRRELGAYFRSPLGFIILSTVLLLDGLLFNAYALGAAERRSSSVLMLFFYFSSGTTLVPSSVSSFRLLPESGQIEAPR